MEIQIFKHEQFGEIRTMTDEKGEPWFVGKDVAKMLGYKNVPDAIGKHVDIEDKGVAKCDTLGGNQKTTIVNESGLYSLILSSKLPQAKAFKRWVTSEVLPQIRKTGGYIPLKDKDGRELSDLEIMCRATMILKRSLEEKERLIADLQPKADYADEVLDSVDCLTMTQVAKGLGMTVHELTTKLRSTSSTSRADSTCSTRPTPGGSMPATARTRGATCSAMCTRGRTWCGRRRESGLCTVL